MPRVDCGTDRTCAETIYGAQYTRISDATPPMDITQFEKMLDRGEDTAMLRFTLGQEYLKRGDADSAVRHLGRAVDMDPDYSSAWKLYGKALAETGDDGAAGEAFEEGIEVAERKGDKQAAKEMRVFLKRLSRDD